MLNQYTSYLHRKCLINKRYFLVYFTRTSLHAHMKSVYFPGVSIEQCKAYATHIQLTRVE